MQCGVLPTELKYVLSIHNGGLRLFDYDCFSTDEMITAKAAVAAEGAVPVGCAVAAGGVGLAPVHTKRTATAAIPTYTFCDAP